MNTEHSEQLERYVLRPDAFSGYLIPKRIQRQDVAGFVVARVERDASLKSLVRLESLVNYYDLQEVCGHLFTLLPPAPISPPLDIARGAVIARTIASTCVPADVQKAAAYSGALIAGAQRSSDIVELLELQERLGPGFDASALAARIQQLRAYAATRAPSDYQARLETSTLDEMGNLRLPRVQSANAVKAQVLSMPDRPKRIWEEIKMYLTVEHGYLEYLTPWAVLRLRRETWGEGPAAQFVRKEEPHLRAELARMFRAVAANLEKMPDVLPENVPSLRVRCYRAVEFFGGALSSDERSFVARHAAGQADLLSYD